MHKLCTKEVKAGVDPASRWVGKKVCRPTWFRSVYIGVPIRGRLSIQWSTLDVRRWPIPLIAS